MQLIRHSTRRAQRQRAVDRRWAHRVRFLAALVLALSVAIGDVHADEGDEHVDSVMGRAVVAPVPRLLERVREEFRGRVLKLELEDEDEGLVYEVKLLTPGGHVLKLYYDAERLELLKVKGRHDHRRHEHERD